MTNISALFTDELSEKEVPLISTAKLPPYKILLVDDEAPLLQSLKQVFAEENYQIFTAPSAEEALDLLSKESCHLIICDYQMPKMNGAELLGKIKVLYPDMIRIMLTSQADTGSVMGAIKTGAVYKFTLKPWNDEDLRLTVALALEQYDLLQKSKKLSQPPQEAGEAHKDRAGELLALAKLSVTNRSQLAIMLHKHHLLNEQQVQKLHKHQQERKEPILKQIIERNWLSEREIRSVLRKDMLFEEINLNEIEIDPNVASLLPRNFCERYWVLPVRKIDKKLTLVMADPMDVGLINDLQFSTGSEIRVAMTNSQDILAKLKNMFGEKDLAFDELATLLSTTEPFEGIEILIEEEGEVSLEELLHNTEEPTAIRLVNVIVLEALRLGASDIHIQPRTKQVVVRYRIDGVLQDKIQFPLSLHPSLISRVKVMSELDITERRRPQDGRITVKTSTRIVDLRISTLPTINGEKVVMRILDRNSTVHNMEDLGLSVSSLAKATNIASKPQGIILATGPTGSGKTTTLYALLQHNATNEKNYMTLEDPVEYYLDIAGQVGIRPKIGLDFATVLRSILRQDPDVILVGEIRDPETAEVAFNAALTGHLVYSTLHTNSAVATLARLLDLGLKPYVIASALELIIAQRLVRKNCTHCVESVAESQDLIHKLGPVFQSTKEMHFFRGMGCEKCNQTGYKGRLGLFEVLVPSERMRHLISSGASILEITETAIKDGIVTLVEDAHEKVHQGLTSADEVLRVLGPQIAEGAPGAGVGKPSKS